MTSVAKFFTFSSSDKSVQLAELISYQPESSFDIEEIKNAENKIDEITSQFEHKIDETKNNNKVTNEIQEKYLEICQEYIYLQLHYSTSHNIEVQNCEYIISI